MNMQKDQYHALTKAIDLFPQAKFGDNVVIGAEMLFQG